MVQGTRRRVRAPSRDPRALLSAHRLAAATEDQHAANHCVSLPGNDRLAGQLDTAQPNTAPDKTDCHSHTDQHPINPNHDHASRR
jgi:hypothetical protein